jgi:hypothetical protein
MCQPPAFLAACKTCLDFSPLGKRTFFHQFDQVLLKISPRHHQAPGQGEIGETIYFNHLPERQFQDFRRLDDQVFLRAVEIFL